MFVFQVEFWRCATLDFLRFSKISPLAWKFWWLIRLFCAFSFAEFLWLRWKLAWIRVEARILLDFGVWGFKPAASAFCFQIFVKIENLVPPSKRWSSPEKLSILPKKLGETYLFRLASYFCMCSKLRFRSKFLSSSKFRSFSKFRSKFFKIGGSWGFSKIHLHCRWNFQKRLFWGVQKFWKTWIWIFGTIEISISTEISDKISLFYTYKNMMQAEKDMFHPVFWEGLTFFRGNSIF